MNEAHTTKYSVHSGSDKMHYDKRDLFWWPGMKKDIVIYVSMCSTCSKVMAEHQKPSVLQQQPKILEWKWEKITMDIVTKFPKSGVFCKDMLKGAQFTAKTKKFEDHYFLDTYAYLEKFYHLSDNDDEEETDEDDAPSKIEDLFTFKIQGTKAYEEYESNNHMMGELLGMVRVGGMTYFQDHKWYDELANRNLKDETLMHKTIDVLNKSGRVLVGKELEATNAGDIQDNQGHEERRDNPTYEPSVYKVRRFEMMKYSFNAEEEYIAIKESEYLNHLKDNLDAYREIL
ncbi:putative reverse transcriptase domain-containing protein [Tanacetum coccineum]